MEKFTRLNRSNVIMEDPFQCGSCGDILDGSEDSDGDGICGICRNKRINDEKDAEISALKLRVAELENQLKEKNL